MKNDNLFNSCAEIADLRFQKKQSDIVKQVTLEIVNWINHCNAVGLTGAPQYFSNISLCLIKGARILSEYRTEVDIEAIINAKCQVKDYYRWLEEGQIAFINNYWNNMALPQLQRPGYPISRDTENTVSTTLHNMINDSYRQIRQACKEQEVFDMLNNSEKNIQVQLNNFNRSLDIIYSCRSTAYENYIYTFIEFVEKSPEIKSIIEPYLNIELKLDTIETDEGLNFPKSIDKRIAYILQMFYTVYKDDKNLQTRLYILFRYPQLIDNYVYFNDEFVKPTLEYLREKINASLGQSAASEKTSPISITIGELNNNQGNIALTNFGQQTVNVQGLADDIAKKLIEFGFNELEVKKAKSGLEIIEKEALKTKPDKSIIQKGLNIVYKAGKKVMVNKLVDYLGKPELQAIAIDFIHNHLPHIVKGV